MLSLVCAIVDRRHVLAAPAATFRTPLIYSEVAGSFGQRGTSVDWYRLRKVPVNYNGNSLGDLVWRSTVYYQYGSYIHEF